MMNHCIFALFRFQKQCHCRIIIIFSVTHSRPSVFVDIRNTNKTHARTNRTWNSHPATSNQNRGCCWPPLHNTNTHPTVRSLPPSVLYVVPASYLAKGVVAVVAVVAVVQQEVEHIHHRALSFVRRARRGVPLDIGTYEQRWDRQTDKQTDRHGVANWGKKVQGEKREWLLL